MVMDAVVYAKLNWDGIVLNKIQLANLYVVMGY